MTSVAELRQQAEPAMREDAPAAAALAREQLLRLYRERHATSHRLDIESNDQAGVRWGASDIEALAWLCRLSAAGHCGASRLIDRALSLGVPASGDNPAMRELGLKYPRVARYVARSLSERPQFDVGELRAWLERAGGVHARIAEAMRAAFAGGARHGKELDTLRYHVARAERAGEEGWETPQWPQDLVAEVASQRLLRTSAQDRPAAQALLEHAAALGSKAAREELWLQLHAAAADKRAFVRDWVAANPMPRDVGLAQGRLIGETLGAEAGMPWYAAALGFSLPAADACHRIARGFIDRWRENADALAWIERGIERGEAASLQQWLEACYRQDLGIAREAAAALERVRRGLASGIVPGAPGLLGMGRLFSRLPAEWREVVELLGYTAEVAAKERAAEEEAQRRRADANLELALAYLPSEPDMAQHLLERVLQSGDAAQRSRAREILDGDDWPPPPAEDVELWWKLFDKLEAQFAAGDQDIPRPELFAKYLSRLTRYPATRDDARYPRLQAVLARVTAAADAEREKGTG